MKTIVTLFALTACFGTATTLCQAQTPQKKETRMFHFKWVDERNGQKRTIDTSFEAGPDFDEKAFLRSLNINPDQMPPSPDGKKISRIIVAGDEPTDSGYQEIIMIQKGDTVKKRIVIKEININSTTPEDLQSQLELIEHNLPLDSGTRKLVFIGGAELEGSEDIQVIAHDSGNIKKIMVMKRILITRIEQSDPLPNEELKSDGRLSVEKINIFPNPASGKFRLNFDLKTKGNTDILITDSKGQVVFSETLKNFSGAYTREIDLGATGQGIFYIKVQQGKHSLSSKAILN